MSRILGWVLLAWLAAPVVGSPGSECLLELDRGGERAELARSKLLQGAVCSVDELATALQAPGGLPQTEFGVRTAWDRLRVAPPRSVEAGLLDALQRSLASRNALVVKSAAGAAGALPTSSPAVVRELLVSAERGDLVDVADTAWDSLTRLTDRGLVATGTVVALLDEPSTRLAAARLAGLVGDRASENVAAPLAEPLWRQVLATLAARDDPALEQCLLALGTAGSPGHQQELLALQQRPDLPEPVRGAALLAACRIDARVTPGGSPAMRELAWGQLMKVGAKGGRLMEYAARAALGQDVPREHVMAAAAAGNTLAQFIATTRGWLVTAPDPPPVPAVQVGVEVPPAYRTNSLKYVVRLLLTALRSEPDGRAARLYSLANGVAVFTPAELHENGHRTTRYPFDGLPQLRWLVVRFYDPAKGPAWSAEDRPAKVEAPPTEWNDLGEKGERPAGEWTVVVGAYEVCRRNYNWCRDSTRSLEQHLNGMGLSARLRRVLSWQ